MIRLIALLALLTAPPLVGAQESTQHYYIFGDSLSSPSLCNWPNYLDGPVHNYAQAALTLKAFDYPSHLYIRPGGIVIVYIGTNDAGRGHPVAGYGRKLRLITQQLVELGATVYLVGQPYLDIVPGTILDEYRAETEAVAIEFGATYLDPGWGTDDTTDGVHPDCWGQFYLSVWLREAMGVL